MSLHPSHFDVLALLAVVFYHIRHFNIFALLVSMVLTIRSPREWVIAAPFISLYATARVGFNAHMFPVMIPAKTGTVLLAITAFVAGSMCFALVFLVLSRFGLGAEVLGASMLVQRAIAQGQEMVHVHGSQKCEDCLVYTLQLKGVPGNLLVLSLAKQARILAGVNHSSLQTFVKV